MSMVSSSRPCSYKHANTLPAVSAYATHGVFPQYSWQKFKAEPQEGSAPGKNETECPGMDVWTQKQRFWQSALLVEVDLPYLFALQFLPCFSPTCSPSSPSPASPSHNDTWILSDSPPRLLQVLLDHRLLPDGRRRRQAKPI